MRIFLIAGAALFLALPAMAADRPNACAAFGSAPMRIVAGPAPCCGGRLHCGQFLSTTIVVRPSRDQHT